VKKSFVKTPLLLASLIVALVFVARPGLATEINAFDTPAGLGVWYVQEKSIPILSVELSFPRGSVHEPDGLGGLANMVSATLDEGAGDLNSLAFQTRLEELAISMSFGSSKDAFRISLKTLSKNRDEAFRLLGLALQKPRFDDKAVERIRRQIQTRIIGQQEDANAIAAKAWFKKTYGDHPYGRPTLGTKESIARITPADLRDWVGKNFRRDGLLIGAVGDVDQQEISRLLDLALAGLKRKVVTPEVSKIMPTSTGSTTVIRKPNPQSVVMFGMPGIMRDDPDYYAAYVMNYVLGGGGFTSRLYQEVREKRGLAYSVYSYIYPYENSAIYLGGLGTANERVAESLEVVKAEIAKLADSGISADELAKAKVFLNGSFPLRLDSNAKIARMLVAIRISDLGLDYIDKRPALINAVTVEDIRRVARRLLISDAITWVIVGDPAGIDG
jgi:zinc protease